MAKTSASITLVGTGEAPDTELPNCSVLYRGDHTLLLDCGTGVPAGFWRLSRDTNLLDGIWISHRHADHSFGLPALLLWMRFGGRSRPLKILGGPGTGDWLRGLLELAYPGAWSPEKCFQMQIHELAPGAPLELDELKLSVARSHHGVVNHSLRIEEHGVATCYSGDGSPTDATRALFSHADLLVHECYTADGGYAGHAAASELLAMADELAIKQLCLVHLGVDHKQAIHARAAEYNGRSRIHLPAPGDMISA